MEGFEDIIDGHQEESLMSIWFWNVMDVLIPLTPLLWVVILGLWIRILDQ
ncbi:hypothetical protein [Microcystis phage Mwe-JY26]